MRHPSAWGSVFASVGSLASTPGFGARKRPSSGQAGRRGSCRARRRSGRWRRTPRWPRPGGAGRLPMRSPCAGGSVFASVGSLAGTPARRPVARGRAASPREARGVAFGRGAGGAPGRFLVGLAVLGLLSEVAAGRPLLCLVDDAQWLDQASAQVLAFVARRLDAESVALLFGTRDRAGEGGLAGLPRLALGGLADADARAVLASGLPGRLGGRGRDPARAESAR